MRYVSTKRLSAIFAVNGCYSAPYLNYGVIIPGGAYRGWCPDDRGGALSGVIIIPGTWVCCVGSGNNSNVRGGIIRRIA